MSTPKAKLSPMFPTLTERERLYPAMPAAADGFPDGWVVRRVPRSSNNSNALIDNLFYSPKLGLKFRTKPAARRFIDCLNGTGESDEAAALVQFREEDMKKKKEKQAGGKRATKNYCTHNSTCYNIATSIGGLCRKHGPRCAWEGCENNIHARGMCKKHDSGAMDAADQSPPLSRKNSSSSIVDERSSSSSVSIKLERDQYEGSKSERNSSCDVSSITDIDFVNRDNNCPERNNPVVEGNKKEHLQKLRTHIKFESECAQGAEDNGMAPDIDNEQQKYDAQPESDDDDVMIIDVNEEKYTTCAWEGCGSGIHTSGLCKKHHKERKRNEKRLHKSSKRGVSEGINNMPNCREVCQQSTVADPYILSRKSSSTQADHERSSTSLSMKVKLCTHHSICYSVATSIEGLCLKHGPQWSSSCVSSITDMDFVDGATKQGPECTTNPVVKGNNDEQAQKLRAHINFDVETEPETDNNVMTMKNNEREENNAQPDTDDDDVEIIDIKEAKCATQKNAYVDLTVAVSASSVEARSDSEKSIENVNNDSINKMEHDVAKRDQNENSSRRQQQPQRQSKEDGMVVVLPSNMKLRLKSLIPRKGKGDKKGKGNRGIGEGDILSKVKGFVVACQGVAIDEVLKGNFPDELEVEMLNGRKRFFFCEDGDSSRPISETATVNNDGGSQDKSGMGIEKIIAKEDVKDSDSLRNDLSPKQLDGPSRVVPRLVGEMKASILSVIPRKEENSDGVRLKFICKKVEGFTAACDRVSKRKVLEGNLLGEIEIAEIDGVKRYFQRHTPISEKDKANNDDDMTPKPNIIDNGKKESEVIDRNANEKARDSMHIETNASDDGRGSGIIGNEICGTMHSMMEKLIELTHTQAGETKFPPGCKVVYNYKQETNSSKSIISLGVVSSVYISLSGNFVYRLEAVATNKGKEVDDSRDRVMMNEDLLAFAPTTLVYFQPNSSTQTVWKEGTVLLASITNDGSANRGRWCYSVMASSDDGEHVIGHDVPPERLSHRAEASAGGHVQGLKHPPTPMPTEEQKEKRKEDGANTSTQSQDKENAPTLDKAGSASRKPNIDNDSIRADDASSDLLLTKRKANNKRTKERRKKAKIRKKARQISCSNGGDESENSGGDGSLSAATKEKSWVASKRKTKGKSTEKENNLLIEGRKSNRKQSKSSGQNEADIPRSGTHKRQRHGFGGGGSERQCSDHQNMAPNRNERPFPSVQHQKVRASQNSFASGAKKPVHIKW